MSDMEVRATPDLAPPGSVPTRTHGPGPQLTVATRPMRGGAVLDMSGELDLAVAAGWVACVDAALADGLPRVVLDVAGLAFCDCAGLGSMLRARRLAVDAGGGVRLARARSGLARSIEVLRLNVLFPYYATPDAAFDGLPTFGWHPGRNRGRVE